MWGTEAVALAAAWALGWSILEAESSLCYMRVWALAISVKKYSDEKHAGTVA